MMKLTKSRITYLKVILSLVFLVTLTTCGFKDRISNRQTIKYAEQLMGENPDSALRLLNTVQTGLLNQLHYARYQVILARTKDRPDISDTTVFLARDYLVDRKDDYAAQACFVTANIYHYQKKDPLAIADYLKAAKLVKEDDYGLKVRINYNLARIYFLQRSYEESLEHVRQAQIFASQTELSKTYNIYILELMGLDYLYMQKTDSALYYFDKIQSSCLESDHSYHLYYLCLALRNTSQYTDAKRKCFQALSLINPEDSLMIGRIYLTLATIYDKTNQPDSACIWGYQSKPLLDKSDDIIDLVDLYNLLSELELEKGNWEQASFYRGKHEAFINIREYTDRMIKEEQQKRQQEDTQAIQEKLNRSLIKTLVLRNTVIVLVSMIMVALGIFFFLKYRKKQKSRIDEMEEKHGDEIGKYVDEIGKCEGKIERYEHKIEKYEHEIERYADEIEEERQQLEEERQQHEHVINSERERFTEIRQQLGQYEQQVRQEREKINKQRLNLISRVRDLSSLGAGIRPSGPCSGKG